MQLTTKDKQKAKKLKLFVNKRIELAQYYNDLFLDLSNLIKPVANDDINNYGLHPGIISISTGTDLLGNNNIILDDIKELLIKLNNATSHS